MYQLLATGIDRGFQLKDPAGVVLSLGVSFWSLENLQVVRRIVHVSIGVLPLLFSSRGLF